MARKTTLTIQCRKEQVCVSCGAAFAYPISRKFYGKAWITGDGPAEARTLAAASAASKVVQQPCPNCGIFQPEMVGAWHSYRFGILLGLCLSVWTAVLLSYALTAISRHVMIWSATSVAALALVWYGLIACRHPNRNLDGNRDRAERRIQDGDLELVRRSESAAAERDPTMPFTRHGFVVILLTIGVASIALPELWRLNQGRPLNEAWDPPIAGPGDEALVYFPIGITSVDGLWRGAADVVASDAEDPKRPAVRLSATTRMSDWGNIINAKTEDTSKSSKLWLRVRFPDNAELEGKRLLLKMTLTVSYPEAKRDQLNRLGFVVTQTTRSHNTEILLGPPHIGRTYIWLCWGGFSFGGTLILVVNIILIRRGNWYKRQALPAQVDFVGEVLKE